MSQFFSTGTILWDTIMLSFSPFGRRSNNALMHDILHSFPNITSFATNTSTQLLNNSFITPMSRLVSYKISTC